jgi:uncharacterized protein
VKSRLAAFCIIGVLGACAARQPDHFYVLGTQPPGAGSARTSPVTPLMLRVAVSPVFDRAEMVVNTSPDGVAILEHERWAASLSDLMRQALARNLEARRSDLLVSGQNAAHATEPVARISVDVVQLTAYVGGQASIEAHWSIVDPRTGKDRAGGEVFTATSTGQDYAALAQALSRCLGSLADRLVEQLK